MAKKGSKVKWTEEQETVTGKVVETAAEITGEIIDGQMVTRRGRPENKALIIERKDGQTAVKLETEVETESKND